MVLIGVDPHKGSHTAVAIDRDERELAGATVRADRRQLERLLTFAAPFEERSWAIESAGGLGYLLAQQLVGAGEQVVDVPPTLAARVRLLGSGRASKNDPNDALATAVAALRDRYLRTVVGEDHAMVLRMLADRHQDLTALRTQAICRLHVLMRTMVAGGARNRLSAKTASSMLRRVQPASAVETHRKMLALELLADVRRLDRAINTMRDRAAAALVATNSSLLAIHGVGPIVAALLIGHAGDVSRFPTAGHFASYNGTAPIEASSGPRVRHRLNPRGNRQLNHAIHLIAICQIRHDTPGRIYYQRKLTEGKSVKEARRALKRRISDAVYRALRDDLK